MSVVGWRSYFVNNANNRRNVLTFRNFTTFKIQYRTVYDVHYCQLTSCYLVEYRTYGT